MSTPPRLRPLAVCVVAAAVVLTGCTSAGTDGAATTRTVVSTLPPLTTLTVTTGSIPPSSSPSRTATTSGPAASTRSGPVSSTAAAPTTALPAAVAGQCPYLKASDVAQLTGQRTGPGRTIATTPAPICEFTRSDGGWLAAVRVFRTPDAATAAAAVDARVPVGESSPTDKPAGWTGGYLGLPSGTSEYPDARSVYGVSKGSYAVVAWTNQAQSIKSRRLVNLVIVTLQL